jgi:uncharacterized membrane protein YgaE (UPF0421/DUF939 family)
VYCILRAPVPHWISAFGSFNMFKAELDALRATLKLSQPTLRETLVVAGLYAGQAVVCVVILKWLYTHQHWDAVLWAMISAILALQPGLSQSAVTSVIRIAANTVGAGVALGIGQIPIAPEFQLIASLIVVVFICELLRLELALRTACVAAVIVLTNSEGHVFTTGTERFTATIIGCMMALVAQLMTDLIRKKVAGKPTAIMAVKS